MQPAAQGVCPRCSIEGGKGLKKLYRCPFCGGYFCEKHAEPRLVMSFQTCQAFIERAASDFLSPSIEQRGQAQHAQKPQTTR